jgi:hypothetical protein
MWKDWSSSQVRHEYPPLRIDNSSITGDLAEEHPVLLEELLFIGVMLFMPEITILRPLLGIFGFSPHGPRNGLDFLFVLGCKACSSQLSCFPQALLLPGHNVTFMARQSPNVAFSLDYNLRP